jgi:hypothetical protein
MPHFQKSAVIRDFFLPTTANCSKPPAPAADTGSRKSRNTDKKNCGQITLFDGYFYLIIYLNNSVPADLPLFGPCLKHPLNKCGPAGIKVSYTILSVYSCS